VDCKIDGRVIHNKKLKFREKSTKKDALVKTHDFS
jgi:hypothetical protein